MMKWLPSLNASNRDNFFRYLCNKKSLLVIAVCISACLFAILKYCYPLPDFFVDSVNYVLWAHYDLAVAFRPMGYSYFLQMMHSVSAGWGTLIFVQYFIFVLSSLFFFFSADYLFGVPKKLALPLMLAILCNPMLLLQTNLVSSDSIFCSLTVTWFTTCLWIIKKPGWWIWVAQLIFLYLAFKVRYSALFFPVISAIVFLFCKARRSYKITGIVATGAMIYLIVWYQQNLTEYATNTKTFSGFAGWQIANNALYCYPYIDLNPKDLPTQETRIVDECVRMKIDSVVKDDNVGYVYLWDRQSPFKKYLGICAYRHHTNYLVSWFNASVGLKAYGWYIIRHYPAEFMKYFILPNCTNYFYPPAEILDNYDNSSIKLPPETIAWFGFDNDHLRCTYPNLQNRIISVYPALSLILNLLNIGTILFILLGAILIWKKIASTSKALLIVWSCFYFGYMGFSIFASAVNLRFLDYLFVMGIVMPFILIKDGSFHRKR
jgi:hypothetical protein